VADCCTRGNEPSGSIKYGECLDWVRIGLLPEKDCISCSLVSQLSGPAGSLLINICRLSVSAKRIAHYPKMSPCLNVCHLWNKIFSVTLSSFDTKKLLVPAWNSAVLDCNNNNNNNNNNNHKSGFGPSPC